MFRLHTAEIVRWSTAVLRQALSHSLPGQGAAGVAGGAGRRAAPRLQELRDEGPGDEPGAAAGLRPGPAEGGAGDHDPGEPGQAAALEGSEK